MALNHPAAKRAWLQTAGLPLDPIHADLRAAFDRVEAVDYIGGACFKLRNADGRQVGIVQFQHDEQAAVDQAIAATTERLATGAAKPVDLAAGDTLIRRLDMSNPEDRTLAQSAISRPDAAIVVPDSERQDPPPIDLPDYAPTDDPESMRAAERVDAKGVKGLVIGLAAASLIWGLLVLAYLLTKG